MQTKEFIIEGMSCGHCVKAVEIEFSKIALKEFQVAVGSAEVTYDENSVDETKITAAIDEAGFKVVK